MSSTSGNFNPSNPTSWPDAFYLAKLANQRLDALEAQVAAQSIFTLVYADEVARLAAGPFTAADVGRVAWQQSDNTFWQLTDHDPITWTQVSGSSAIPLHAVVHLPGGLDELATGIPSTIGATNEEGSAAAFARQDHVHALPVLDPDPSGTWNSVTVDALGRVVGGSIVPVSLSLQDAYDGGSGVAPTIELDAVLGGITVREWDGITASDIAFGIQSDDGGTTYLAVMGGGGIVVNGQIVTDLIFGNAAGRTVSVAASTAADGKSLSVAAGQGAASYSGGALLLAGGSVAGSQGGNGGGIYPTASDGAFNMIGDGGDGGEFSVYAGSGGHSATGRGGDGGIVRLMAGSGGYGYGTDPPGHGGIVQIEAGGAGGNEGFGGAVGGDVYIRAGASTGTEYGGTTKVQGGANNDTLGNLGDVEIGLDFTREIKVGKYSEGGGAWDITTRTYLYGDVSRKRHKDFAGSDSFDATGAVQTTDATPTSLLTYTLEDTFVATLRVVVTARNEDGSERGSWALLILCHREGAGAVLDHGGEAHLEFAATDNPAAWDVDVDVDGDDVRVLVTGEAGKTINWVQHVTHQAVSGAA